MTQLNLNCVNCIWF